MDCSAIAILPGGRVSFLDHLAPLCDLMKIPLLCTDQWVKACAEIFYPDLTIILANQENFQRILSNYQTFFTVEPCRLHKKAYLFGTFLFRGDAITVSTLHGNTDKFRSSYWIERYAHEDIHLFYGQQHVEFLQEKGVWNLIAQKVRMGNLRLKFYNLHKKFFDSVSQTSRFPLSKNKTLLYAPTWGFKKGGDDSNFFDVYPYVLDDIPQGYQILVKLHPYMFRLFPEKITSLMEKYQDKEHILFIDEIPLIYPFLNDGDIYLGDYSSIGYDFLSFNRPLFFLGEEKGNLQHVGIKIRNLKNLYSYFEKKDQFSEQRALLYEKAFGASLTFETIKFEIDKVLLHAKKRNWDTAGTPHFLH